MKIYLVGRDSACDIVLEDNSVSRNHLQLAVEDDGSCRVVDLNSTNGTYVNGTRIRGNVLLMIGDEVRLGNIKLEWERYCEKPYGSEDKKHRKYVGLYIGVGLGCLLCVLVLLVNVMQSTRDGKVKEKDIEALKEQVDKYKEKLEGAEQLERAKDMTQQRLEKDRKEMARKVETSEANVKKKDREIIKIKLKAEKAEKEKNVALYEKEEEFRKKVAAERAFEDYLKKEFAALTQILNDSTLAILAIKIGIDKETLTFMGLEAEFNASDNARKVEINRAIKEVCDE